LYNRKSMKRKITQLRILTLILTILEILFVGAFLTIYLLDLWNIDEIVKPEYIAYGGAGFVFIDALYIYRMLHEVYKLRARTDLTTNEIIGSDIQEAYLFGKIGFLVIDNEGIVIWESDLLKQRQINVINFNIYEWQPKLKDFTDKDIGDTMNLTIDTATYSVKFLRNAGLFIFKDVSELETLSVYSKDQATCVGLITIDNFADIAGSNEENNDTIVRVRATIFDYAKKYNVLLRSFKSDTYLAISNYKSLLDMKSDTFSLLGQVRAIGQNDNIQPTLSIGFAHGFPDVNKLYEMASNAVDIAMSRGGDQAVLSKYGSELEFFGGKTEAVEKRNKVKVRVIADSLVGLIDKASNVIVMGHMETDMDSLGSCLGVKAICDSRNKPCFIVFEPKLAERKARSAMTSLYSRDQLDKFTVTTKEAIEKTKSTTLVIVVDISRPSLTLCPEILELTEKVVVLDHHRRAEEFIDNPVLSYIEPSASSVCELIAEMIKYGSKSSEIKLDPTAATIMLAGIFLDTSYYKNKSVGQRTFEASMILEDYGADNSAADDLLKDEYEEYILINRIISSMKTPYYGVVYCVSDESDIIERSTLAKVANQCMELKGINAVFVIGRTAEKETRISARSDGTINVQILCEKMGGGGHFGAAAAAFPNKTIKDIETTLLDVLGDYLAEARNTNKGKVEE
jgi:c-di-AMP phosphodiesterase-like protein